MGSFALMSRQSEIGLCNGSRTNASLYLSRVTGLLQPDHRLVELGSEHDSSMRDRAMRIVLRHSLPNPTTGPQKILWALQEISVSCIYTTKVLASHGPQEEPCGASIERCRGVECAVDVPSSAIPAFDTSRT